MPSLIETQEWLRWIITEPRGVNTALLEPTQEPQPRLLDTVVQQPPLSQTERLNVYASGYFSRILGAMATNFSAVRRSLGPVPFQKLVADYLMQNPSRSPNLDDLGHDFPDFSRSHPLSEKFPFLFELALLEWNVLLSLQTDRQPPLAKESLVGLAAEDWSAAVFTLDPTVRLLATSWDVEKVWQERQVPEEMLLKNPESPVSSWSVVYRDDEWVRVKSVSAGEWNILSRLQIGTPLGQAIEECERRFGIENSSLELWFGEWTESGIIKAVTISSGPSRGSSPTPEA